MVFRAAFLMLLGCAGNLFGQLPAITGFTDGTAFGSVNGTDQTLGWTFTANTNLTVTALGVWQSNTGVPLSQTHQVGLWTSAGTMLASGTVLTNSPVTGSWRYVPITPVSLTSGQSYTVGSAVTSPYLDTYSRVDLPGGTVATSSLITIGGSVVSASASGFAYPSTTNAAFLARLGPNLLIIANAPTSANTAAGAPVSAWTLLLIGAGIASIAAITLRRQDRQAA